MLAVGQTSDAPRRQRATMRPLLLGVFVAASALPAGAASGACTLRAEYDGNEWYADDYWHAYCGVHLGSRPCDDDFFCAWEEAAQPPPAAPAPLWPRP